jgi:ABC-type molybdate transport system substrate-binding protein
MVTPAVLSLCASPALSQLNVIMSGGFSAAYQQVLPEFEKASGITVRTAKGASQGTGPQTIADQLQRGAPADVVILSREGLAELIAAGPIMATCRASHSWAISRMKCNSSRCSRQPSSGDRRSLTQRGG